MKKFLLLTLVAGSACAQTLPDSTSQLMSTTQRRLSLLTAYNGFKHQFLEIGIARNDLQTVGHTAVAGVYFASAEIMIDEEPVIGPKVGAWIGNGLTLGVNALYYTTKTEGALCFRPEVGIGMSMFKVAYGYTGAVTNRDFDRFNRHSISFTCLITLKRFKDRVTPH